ncbi:zinc finger protein [Elysia marginata]|uniref:Zinc finger protein n=1 Tax=Elysia marginata TaxID=1093978 RepID=A0AAV4HRR1_9GAST|nr:zinc finger protein [Elysia marginata]
MNSDVMELNPRDGTVTMPPVPCADGIHKTFCPEITSAANLRLREVASATAKSDCSRNKCDSRNSNIGLIDMENEKSAIRPRDTDQSLEGKHSNLKPLTIENCDTVKPEAESNGGGETLFRSSSEDLAPLVESFVPTPEIRPLSLSSCRLPPQNLSWSSSLTISQTVSDLRTQVCKDSAPNNQFSPQEEEGSKPCSSPKASASQFRCFPCSEDFPDFAKLREHFLREHIFTRANTLEHKCEICGKMFAKDQDLTEHRLLDHQYECNICGMKFIKETNFKYHTETAHLNKLINYVCKICNIDCKTYQRLYKHLNKHTEVKKYLCKLCGKGFAFQGQLNAHVATHNNSFQCDKCGKVFRQLQSFKKHRLVHAGILNVKPYICEICGKRLASKDSHTSHMLSHKGPPPFKCDLCDKGYYSSFNLKNHKKDKHRNPEKILCT